MFSLFFTYYMVQVKVKWDDVKVGKPFNVALVRGRKNCS